MLVNCGADRQLHLICSKLQSSSSANSFFRFWVDDVVQASSSSSSSMAGREISELDDALYVKLKYRAASPLSNLACLDVITKVQLTWDELKSVPEMFLYMIGWRRSLTRLVPRGSMTEELLMADSSKWRFRDAADPAAVEQFQRVRDGLETISRPYITPADEKVLMRKAVCDEETLVYVSTSASSAWLDGIGNLKLDPKVELSASVESLTAAMVNIAQLQDWLEKGYWVPKESLLKSCPTEWSDQHHCDVKKLRIVCEVLYGKKLVQKRSSGKFGPKLEFQGLRGLSGGVELRSVRQGTGVSLKGDQLIIGYRYVQAEFGLDGEFLGAIPSDTGVRAGDDLRERNAIAMGRDDVFEEDEHGNKMRIPLLNPTKEELASLENLIAKSIEEGSVSA